jgi:hypothetical protein
MQFDVFFSISQTPAHGVMPDEATMFGNWLEQVEAADRLGYGVAWLAESHLSSEVQKRNQHPVIPHWEGEVGLNCDMLQSAHHIFARTGPNARHKSSANGGRGIEVGSAVMNILQGGGPIAHAERIAYFAALRGLTGDRRRIHVGFSAGRFDYMNRAHGYVPRDELERTIPYPFLKGKIFDEATEIFCRLLAGETLSSNDIPERTITQAECRTPQDWDRIRASAKTAGRVEKRPASPVPSATAAGGAGASIIPAEAAHVEHAAQAGEVENVVLPRRFIFEELKVVPQHWDRSLVQLVAGSHDPRIPTLANRYLPCRVANLSITPPHIIEQTHQIMARIYHPDGGPWKRTYMPRTVMVFLNEETGLTAAARNAAAQKEAKAALSAYWNALEGTVDPERISKAADNAVIGDAEQVAAQLAQRYHPDDRMMLWFDFFNHDSARVIRNMEAFMEKVAPELALGRSPVHRKV